MMHDKRDPAVAERGGETDEQLSHPSLMRHEMEVILARQLAGYLELPIIIIDPSHVVVYYNEPAERMLGRRFDEGGAIPWSEWGSAFHFSSEDGTPLSSAEMPLSIALRERRPVNCRLRMQGADGIERLMDETAIPLIGNAHRFLGALAIFSEIES